MEKTIQIFITNNKDNKKTTCKFEELDNHAKVIDNVPKFIVIAIDSPISIEDINGAIYKFVKILKGRGIIKYYNNVYPLPNTAGYDKYNDIITVDNKYREGRFEIKVLE